MQIAALAAKDEPLKKELKRAHSSNKKETSNYISRNKEIETKIKINQKPLTSQLKERTKELKLEATTKKTTTR